MRDVLPDKIYPSFSYPCQVMYKIYPVDLPVNRNKMPFPLRCRGSPNRKSTTPTNMIGLFNYARAGSIPREYLFWLMKALC